MTGLGDHPRKAAVLILEQANVDYQSLREKEGNSDVIVEVQKAPETSRGLLALRKKLKQRLECGGLSVGGLH